MKLSFNFPGAAFRFEGERTLLIKRLPVGAQVQAAQVTVTPAVMPGQRLFEEVLTFSGDQEEFGGTKVLLDDAVEVDFHARRTLAFVAGSNLFDSELLVDLGGGVFMAINEYGAILTPEDNGDLYSLPANGVLPGLTVNKFRLRQVPPLSMNVTQVRVRTMPANVSLALGQLTPFWTHVGEMSRAEISTDFAEVLTLFLNEAETVNGYYEIPLVLHSDMLTRLDVAVEIEYTSQESALPPGIDEVNLPYGHDGVAQVENELIQVALPLGAVVTDAAVQVSGSFEESRVVYGPTGPITDVTNIPITNNQSVAQPISLEADTAVTAIDLLLTSTSRAALLYINLMADADGKPFNELLLSQPVRLTLDRDVADAPTWMSVRLPQEFQFKAGERVWLLIQAAEGEAAWHMDEGPAETLGLHQTTTGGLSWRVMQVDDVNGPLAGFFRLRHTPAQYSMPLSVMVGEGDTAVSVSLDRFQPLGRVEFSLDFPEFAAAINQAACQTGPAACPQGEQLQNTNLENWTTVGEEISAPQMAEPAENLAARVITMAPNGEWALVSDGDETIPLLLPYHRPGEAIDLTIDSRQHVVVRGDSQRAYVLSGMYAGAPNQLHVIDSEAFQLLGQAVNMFHVAHGLTLTPDGRHLYIAIQDGERQQAAVMVVDTAVLEQLLNGGADFDIEDAFVGGNLDNPIPLADDVVPTGLTVSPDGRQLFVAVRHVETNAGSVYIIDTSTHQPLLADPLFVGLLPSDIVMTPDGRFVLVTNADQDSISVINAARLRLQTTLFLENPNDFPLRPTATEVSPDGRRAFVANQSNQSVSVIDLVNWTIAQPIVIGQLDGGDFDIGVTPQGDRLYAVIDQPYPGTVGLFYLTLGRQLPDNWTLMTGFARPIFYTNPFNRTALLGPYTGAERETRPSRPASLSQVVPAVGGCQYEISFWGVSADVDAAAEVIWRGDGCAFQRNDRIPIQVVKREEKGRETEVSSRSRVQLDLPELYLHRERLQAPDGATQAEIRFLVPPEKLALVDMVSLQATREAVNNSDLRLVVDDELVGWRLIPETAVGVNLVVGEEDTRLGNAGSDPFSIGQTFPVTAAQPFVLSFRGQQVTALAAGAAAQVELHWLAADNIATGEVTSLSITAEDDEHLQRGTVPTNAAEAELRADHAGWFDTGYTANIFPTSRIGDGTGQFHSPGARQVNPFQFSRCL